MTDSLPARFLAFLERHPGLVPRGGSVLVALSGGPDSLALLHLLAELRPQLGCRVAAAHFDHGLRAGSAPEAERVARWAADLGVACALGRAGPLAAPSQATLRRERYGFLWREVERRGADRLATGHQADDQAETVLFRLLRGSGLRGLAGIPLQRGRLVRPLLPFWRSELENWLVERRIPYLDDPSNADRRWTRARLRHELIPALEACAGRPVRPILVALAAEARRADRVLQRSAARALRDARLPDSGLRFERDGLAAVDPEVQGRAIRIVAESAGASLTRGGTAAAVEFISQGRSGAAIDLADNLRLGRDFDALWFGPAGVDELDRELTIVSPATGESRVTLGGREYVVSWGETGAPSRASASSADESEPDAWRVDLPLGELKFPLAVRGPRPGDRIRLRGGTRKLKKLFGEQRVPRSWRPRTPVVADAGGRIVWVAGLASACAGVASGGEASGVGTRFTLAVGAAEGWGGAATRPQRCASSQVD